MRIYAIDDEENALEYIVRKIKAAEPSAEVLAFTDPNEAIKSAKNLMFDVVFLDIQMPGINGIDTARKLKKINLKSNIVFVTGYSDYTIDAFAVDASGYLLKPATTEQVRHALDNLRYPIQSVEGPCVTVQCFGNFEIFCNGEPIRFKYSKSKELLAYLTDRKGAVCRNEEVIVNLWEDDEDHASYYRSMIKDIQDSLKAIGCEDIFVKQWGGSAIVKEKIRCDYYDYLDGKASGINAYKGEYMIQYSWAEETAGALYDEL